MINDFQLLVSSNQGEPSPAQTATIGDAEARLRNLLGPAPAGGHLAMERGDVGRCRVCGVFAPMTFEHIPPQSSGNKARRRGLDMMTALRGPLGELPTTGWSPMQRGVGVYATCRDCNSLSGREYVPAYTDAVSKAVGGLQAAFTQYPDDGSVPETCTMTLANVRPGAIVRQALFMVLATSGSAGLGDYYPVLREIVLDKQIRPLPTEMTLRLSLVVSQRIRLNHLQAEIDLDSGTERAHIEIAHLPFAWLAEFGSKSTRTSAVVTSWSEVDTDAVQNVTLSLSIGAVVSPVTGDYRHIWQFPKEPGREASPSP